MKIEWDKVCKLPSTVADILSEDDTAADCFHSFFLSLTEYIQAMILVKEATINNNSTLIKGMYISFLFFFNFFNDFFSKIY